MDIQEYLHKRIQSGVLELPVLSHVAQEAMRVLGDDNCDVKKLADLIDRDQAITGHVLRVANSATYRPVSRVASVRQAVCLVGMREIGRIALMVSTQTRAFKAKGFEHELAALFKHAYAAALFGQEIARVKKLNPEEAFVAALLHDMGRGVLFQEVSDYVGTKKMVVDRHEALQAIDKLHAFVGGLLAEQWKLPARIAEAIRFHHDPERAPFHGSNAAMVQLANLLSHTLDGKSSAEQVKRCPALEALKINETEIQVLLSKADMVRGSLSAAA